MEKPDQPGSNRRVRFGTPPRPGIAKTTVDRCRSLDVNDLNREGLLAPGESHRAPRGLLAAKTVGVEGSRVDLGAQSPALARFGCRVKTAESLAHFSEDVAVAVGTGGAGRDVLEPVVTVGNTGHP